MIAQDCEVDRELQPGIRVTVRLEKGKAHKGTVVSPSEPRTKVCASQQSRAFAV